MISQIVDPPEKLREADACKVGAQHLVGRWGHPDQGEGPLAFVEKRDPRWTA